jgi:hypothetical protein
MSLFCHLDNNLGAHAQRGKVRRQCAEQHVALTLDLADLRLSDTQVKPVVSHAAQHKKCMPRHTPTRQWTMQTLQRD